VPVTDDGLTLDQALSSWKIDLHAANKRPRTIEAYMLAGSQLLDFLKNRHHSLLVAEISRGDIRAFIGEQLAAKSPATAKQRFGSLRVLFGWLLGEGEILSNPMESLSAPSVVDKPVPIVTKRHLELLLEACDSSFVGRRDQAVVMVLWDCGLRASELVGLRVEDVSLDLEIAWIEGKGGRLRKAPFTVQTTRALDRYLRVRSRHVLAHLPNLWLGKQGGLTRNGVGQMLARRSEQAAIGHVHPHMFRHSLVDRALTAGMEEGSVMALMGWSRGSRSLLDRYGAVRQTERAFEAYRKLLG
jgi:site-specific recombinase XerD